jgi:hypothetical protein
VAKAKLLIACMASPAVWTSMVVLRTFSTLEDTIPATNTESKIGIK